MKNETGGNVGTNLNRAIEVKKLSSNEYFHVKHFSLYSMECIIIMLLLKFILHSPHSKKYALRVIVWPIMYQLYSRRIIQ